MKKSIFTVVFAIVFALTLVAQTTPPIDPPKGNGSHQKDTSWTSPGVSKSETRTESQDTIAPARKRKPRFTVPTPVNTNATDGSNVEPGR